MCFVLLFVVLCDLILVSFCVFLFVRYNIDILDRSEFSNNNCWICEIGVLTAATRGERKRRAALDGHMGLFKLLRDHRQARPGRVVGFIFIIL